MIVNKEGHRAKWRVAWIAKGRVIRKDFGRDLPAALELYTKVKGAGRRGATLICVNFAVDPPDHLRPHAKDMIKKDVVKRKGKRKVIKEVVTVRVTPLRKLNAQGIWWCPYCVQLRKFVFKKTVECEGQNLGEPGYYCPICGISHKSWVVRKHNPIAQRMYDEPGKLLKSGSSRRRSRRKRR